MRAVVSLLALSSLFLLGASGVVFAALDTTECEEDTNNISSETCQVKIVEPAIDTSNCNNPNSTAAVSCQYVVKTNDAAPRTIQSKGVRLNGSRDGSLNVGVKNVLFRSYQGLQRFVDNNGSAALFVPQASRGEFRDFLNAPRHLTNISSDYAVSDIYYGSDAWSFDGCAASVFVADQSVNSEAPNVLIPGTNTISPTPLVRISGYTRMQGTTPLNVVVGSKGLNSAIQYTYKRENYSGDCIYDNENNESCVSVLFVQDQSVPFTTGPDLPVEGDMDYTWRIGAITPPVLRYSLNNGTTYNTVADCSAGYSSYAPPINGACGAAQTNAIGLTAAPAAVPPSPYLCARGNIRSPGVTGSGPWTWICDGVGTGATSTNPPCSAGAQGCPISTKADWTVDGNNCSGYTTSATGSGLTTPPVTATGTNSGTATFTCNAGKLTVVQAGATCSGLTNGACGSANGQSYSSAPTTGLCTAGTASASGAWSWNCVGTNGGSTASCSASQLINGICGGANGQTYYTAPTSGLCSAGTPSAYGAWNWTCYGSNGGSSPSCGANYSPAPVNGVCGAANGQSYSSAPTSSLCSAGTASAVGAWSWTCVGANGGTSSSTCSAYYTPAPVNGVCGGANGQSYSSAPTSGLCSSGSASASGAWNWTCYGSNGGSSSSCSATQAAAPVNGSCGSSNAQTYSTAPTSGFCYTGTASAISGTGPWWWTCTGAYGGAVSPLCVSGYHAAINGGCGAANGNTYSSAPSGAALCSSGTASGVSGAGPWSWNCAGVYGGSTSPTCSSSYHAVVTGTCGTANGKAYGSAPSGAALCSSGTASGVSGAGPWSWTCAGSYGGATSPTCSASLSNILCSNRPVYPPYTVPAGATSVILNYTLVGGGGGGNGTGGPNGHGSGGAPGGGGGSTALFRNGGLVNMAYGGGGGIRMATCANGGSTTSNSVSLAAGDYITATIGGGGGGGGNGSTAYDGSYSKSGGGGGGAGYGGGGGGAACAGDSRASGGGYGGGAGSGGSCSGGGGGGGAGYGGGGAGYSYFGGGGGGGGVGQKGGNGGRGSAGGSGNSGGFRSCGDVGDNGGNAGGYGGNPGSVSLSITYYAPTCP